MSIFKSRSPYESSRRRGDAEVKAGMDNYISFTSAIADAAHRKRGDMSLPPVPEQTASMGDRQIPVELSPNVRLIPLGGLAVDKVAAQRELFRARRELSSGTTPITPIAEREAS